MQPKVQVALVALVALVVTVLVAVNVDLAYRYYERLSEANSAPDATPASETTASQRSTPKTTAPEAKSDPSATDLVQRADASNVVANSTYIDDPRTNGKPDALLLVTQARGPGNTANYVHEIGVWYDRYRGGGRWAIFNQDLAPMLEGSTFEVAILEDTDGFVHRAGSANTEGNSTYIDDPRTNGKPDAVLYVTQNWNSGGGDGTYNDHPVGVRYNQDPGKWAIFNEDLTPMPEGAAFNIAVSNGTVAPR